MTRRGLLLLLLIGCTKPSGDAPHNVFIESARLILGDAAPRLPDCRTVETDWGTCLKAGTYEGDPVLLMGHHPYLNVLVEIDYHGASTDQVPCPDSSSDICLARLPYGSATIVVHKATP